MAIRTASAVAIAEVITMAAGMVMIVPMALERVIVIVIMIYLIYHKAYCGIGSI